MFSALLAIVACVVQVIAFAVYNRSILAKDAHPNVASWGIWAFITVLNFKSYQEMSQDWMKSALSTISSLLCIITFIVLVLMKREWKRIDAFDVAAFCLGIVACIWWWYSNSPVYGYVILQASIIIGYVPTVRNVWRKPEDENPLPWFIWTVAFCINAVVVLLRWQQVLEFLYPVQCILGHMLIGVLSLRHRNES